MTANIRRKLHADVLAMFTQGKLPEFDCEWIANLLEGAATGSRGKVR